MQQRCRSFRLFTLYAYISGTLALYALNFLKLQDLQEFVQELQDSCNLKNAYRQHTVSINGAYADSRIDKRMRFFRRTKGRTRVVLMKRCRLVVSAQFGIFDKGFCVCDERSRFRVGVRGDIVI